jgi:hypothetical protein
MRGTLDICCASATSGAARRPPVRAQTNVRRSIPATLHQRVERVTYDFPFGSGERRSVWQRLWRH